VVEAENAPAALTTESYARVSIAFPKILCRHCHIWPMHAKQVNPCRPVGSLFFHDACQYIFHIPAVDWSTSPMLRFHVVVNLTDFDAQVRLRGSWIFHRFASSCFQPSVSGTATDRQPLPQAPPDIVTQPDQLHRL